jgi:hypothetical protein
MSTADTALSISIKMAPGPEHRQEPVAPDKIAESDRTATAATAATADIVVNVENIDVTTTDSSNNSNNDSVTAASAATAVITEQSSNIEIVPANFATSIDSINQSSPPSNCTDSKQVSIAAVELKNRIKM